MADFELDIARFFESSTWTSAMDSVHSRMSSCMSSCAPSDTHCLTSCKQPYENVLKCTDYKKNLYIKRGISFCKHECWDSKDITPCTQRCVQDYSALLKDFQEAVLKRVSSVSFP